MRAIELKGAGFAAEGRKLLSGISFSVEQGEFVCLHLPPQLLHSSCSWQPELSASRELSECTGFRKG